MTTEEKIKVMQAHLDGKLIQICDNFQNNFRDCSVPLWNWVNNDYRIKPEPKYRPYESTEEMIEDFVKRFVHKDIPKYARPFIWVRGKYTPFDFVITVYGKEAVFFNIGSRHELKQLFEEFEYLDGTPVGKLVKE